MSSSFQSSNESTLLCRSVAVNPESLSCESQVPSVKVDTTLRCCVETEVVLSWRMDPFLFAKVSVLCYVGVKEQEYLHNPCLTRA